jgi:hypothetical protein
MALTTFVFAGVAWLGLLLAGHAAAGDASKWQNL